MINFNRDFIYIPFLLILCILVFGCYKNTKELTGNSEVLVKKISGVISENIDVTERNKDWQLTLNNYNYNFQLKDSILFGIPYVGEGYNVSSIISLLFAPKDWRTGSGEPPIIKSLPLSTPKFKNQNLKDSLIWTDILYAAYSGKPKSEVSGLRFVHANALLDFELLGFPVGSVVKVAPVLQMEYMPYKYAENKFQFIMHGKWWIPSTSIKQEIIIYIGNKKYSIETAMNKVDTYYRFNLRFDNNNITIENLKESVWSNEKWPNH